MSGIIITVIVAVGLIGLFAALRGSLRRDAEFERRYMAATAEERLSLDAIRPRSSWRWLNIYSTSPRWNVTWVVALMLLGLVAIGLKWVAN